MNRKASDASSKFISESVTAEIRANGQTNRKWETVVFIMNILQFHFVPCVRQVFYLVFPWAMAYVEWQLHQLG